MLEKLPRTWVSWRGDEAVRICYKWHLYASISCVWFIVKSNKYSAPFWTHPWPWVAKALGWSGWSCRFTIISTDSFTRGRNMYVRCSKLVNADKLEVYRLSRQTVPALYDPVSRAIFPYIKGDRGIKNLKLRPRVKLSVLLIGDFTHSSREP